ncbi:MAG: EutN/CcmL family microcompartment protein [Fimbriimonadaceae bacterium]|nr:EutN/CcmL family microcompartment protein [Fimbriimonadaceae bacterium]
MQLGRVVDQVVSTTKHESLVGQRLLVVQLVKVDRRTSQGKPPLVAVDTVGAAVGQLVLTCEEGKAAKLILQSPNPPVRTLILGIVDE